MAPMLRELRTESGSSLTGELDAFSAHAVKEIGRGCKAFAPLGADARTGRIDRLIGAGAWTEAALALVDMHGWSVRRLDRDDDEWFCVLSRTTVAQNTICTDDFR